MPSSAAQLKGGAGNSCQLWRTTARGWGPTTLLLLLLPWTGQAMHTPFSCSWTVRGKARPSLYVCVCLNACVGTLGTCRAPTHATAPTTLVTPQSVIRAGARQRASVWASDTDVVDFTWHGRGRGDGRQHSGWLGRVGVSRPAGRLMRTCGQCAALPVMIEDGQPAAGRCHRALLSMQCTSGARRMPNARVAATRWDPHPKNHGHAN